MPKRIAIVALLVLLCALLGASAFGAASAAPPLAGAYDGGQMEIAAGLELKPDGRFEYSLSYGAIDEEAAETWTARGGAVVLKSDPTTPPRFVLVSQGKSADGALHIDLDVPEGLSRQYFDALIATGSGAPDRKQLTDDGLVVPIDANAPPTSLRLVLPMFEIASEPLKLDATSGYAVRYRFEPHDLGKVDFDNAPLKIVGGALVLERYGRTITFKRRR